MKKGQKISLVHCIIESKICTEPINWLHRIEKLKAQLNQIAKLELKIVLSDHLFFQTTHWLCSFVIFDSVIQKVNNGLINLGQIYHTPCLIRSCNWVITKRRGNSQWTKFSYFVFHKLNRSWRVSNLHWLIEYASPFTFIDH